MDHNLQVSVGCRDLLIRKLSYAVTCSILSQIGLFIFFLFAANVEPLHPMQWLSKSCAKLFSVNTWLFMILFSAMVFTQSILFAKDYVLQSACTTNRMQKLLSMLSPRQMGLLTMHMFTGASSNCLFLLLNEHVEFPSAQKTFYFLLSGILIGFYYFVRIYTYQKKATFPVIYQYKLMQFKMELFSLIKRSYKVALKPTLFYFGMYFVFGNWLEALLFTEKSDFSVGVQEAMYTWIFASVYVLNMSLMKFCFEVFLTEPVEFPIVALRSGDMTLSSALTMKSVPIIQKLACLDYFNLSHSSKQRRGTLFALSQPGNHPINWNTLLESLLNIFTEYTEILNTSADLILNPPQQKKPDMANKISSNTPVQKNYCYGNMRNLSIVNYDVPLDEINVTRTKNKTMAQLRETLYENTSERLSKALDTMKSKLGIKYLFGYLPMDTIRHCLEDGQVIIWSVQGLSNMLVASLAEDQFGIVQKDLLVALSGFVKLKQCIEKMNRIPCLTRREAGSNDVCIKMKQGIASAVKRSLYNVCLHFGPYLNDLQLSSEVMGVVKNILIEKY